MLLLSPFYPLSLLFVVPKSLSGFPGGNMGKGIFRRKLHLLLLCRSTFFYLGHVGGLEQT